MADFSMKVLLPKKSRKIASVVVSLAFESFCFRGGGTTLAGGVFIGAVSTSGFRAGWQEEFPKKSGWTGFEGRIERGALAFRRYAALLADPFSQPENGYWNDPHGGSRERWTAFAWPQCSRSGAGWAH